MDRPPAASNRSHLAVRLLLGLGLVFTAIALWARGQSSWTVISHEQWSHFGHYVFQPWPRSVLIPKGGHIHAIPGTVQILDVHLFGGHNYSSLFLGNALQLLATALLSVLIWRDKTVDPVARAAAIAATWILAYWLAGLRIQGTIFVAELGIVSLALVALVLCVASAARSRREGNASGSLLWLLTAALWCLAATLSFGLGVATWLCLVVLVAAFRVGRPALAGSSLACATAILVYRDQVAPFLPSERVSLSGIAGDVILWLGVPAFEAARGISASGTVARSVGVATGILGLVGAVVALVWLLISRRGTVRPLEGWCLAAIVFALGAAAITAFAREVGPIHHPRYVCWSVFLWIALIVLGLTRIRVAPERQRGRVMALSILPVALALVLLPSHLETWRSHDARKQELLGSALGVALGVRDPRAARELFREAGIVYRVAKRLAAMDTAMFRWPHARDVGDHLEARFHVDNARLAEARLPGRLRAFARGETTAASFRGRVSTRGVDRVLVTDDAGVIRGAGMVLRSADRRARQGARSEGRPVFGYIPGYDPAENYGYWLVMGETVLPVPGRSADPRKTPRAELE